MPSAAPCANCGHNMWHGQGSKPPGQNICHPCRRKRGPPTPKPPPLPPKTCETCGNPYQPKRHDQRYCANTCRPWPRKPSRFQYGQQHQALKKTLTVQVEAHGAWCAEPICVIANNGGTRWIPPGTPSNQWDLAHDRTDPTGTTYLGPAHPLCNRSEGAKHGNPTRLRRALTRYCQTCGQEFQTIHPAQTYCAKTCRPHRGAPNQRKTNT